MKGRCILYDSCGEDDGKDYSPQNVVLRPTDLLKAVEHQAKDPILN